MTLTCEDDFAAGTTAANNVWPEPDAESADDEGGSSIFATTSSQVGGCKTVNLAERDLDFGVRQTKSVPSSAARTRFMCSV